MTKRREEDKGILPAQTNDVQLHIQKMCMVNPWYPLPADYPTLTEDGQKEARLSILKDHSTPQKLVEAWYLFRRIYLKTQGEFFYRGGIF